MSNAEDHVTDRDRAILWAREILTHDLVCLDTETTGLDYDDEAVSIGLVAGDGAILLDTLLCHEKPCDLKALATHGITWEATRGAPHFREVWPQLVEAIGSRRVLGYNASFDVRIIGQMMSRYSTGLVPTLFCVTAGDVMQKFAEFYGEWSDWHQSYRWQKLTTAAAHFGLSVVGAHGAVADALLTLGVVKKMAESKLSAEEETL